MWTKNTIQRYNIITASSKVTPSKQLFIPFSRTSDENRKNNGRHKGSYWTLIIFFSEVISFVHFAQTNTITMLFIKLFKVQNLTCSRFKHQKTTLMLCNKKNKRIRALHANKDGHSYIWVTFRELHSEKITFRV